MQEARNVKNVEELKAVFILYASNNTHSKNLPLICMDPLVHEARETEQKLSKTHKDWSSHLEKTTDKHTQLTHELFFSPFVDRLSTFSTGTLQSS